MMIYPLAVSDVTIALMLVYLVVLLYLVTEPGTETGTRWTFKNILR